MLTPRRGFLSASGYLALGLGSPAELPLNPSEAERLGATGGVRAPDPIAAIQELCARIYREGAKPDRLWFAEEESAAKFVRAVTGLPYDEALRRVREWPAEEPADDA